MSTDYSTFRILQPNFIYVFADVNGLKYINDNLGHAAGDELIKGAASCLDNAFSKYGTVYRMGGDEFSAILYISDDDYQNLP